MNFKNLNFKEKPKSLTGWIKTILAFIVVFNIAIFFVVISNQTLDRPYPKAKAFMGSAYVVHFLYAYPLSKVFGYNSLIAKPFRGIRDSLLNTAINLAPDNDAEGAMYWFRIRYVEFQDFYAPQFGAYVSGEKEFREKDIKDYLNRSNELYENLDILANKPLKDKFFKEKRLGAFHNVAWWYLETRPGFINRLNIVNENSSKLEDDYFYMDSSEISKLKDIIDWSKSLKTYTKQNEPTGYRQFYSSGNWDLDPLVLNEASLQILMSKIAQKTFSCEAPLLNLYEKSRYSLINEAGNDPKISKYRKYKAQRKINRHLNKIFINYITDKCYK